ncbi:MAG: hypothetical protein ACI9MC_001354 [Kiritimatiellia bacterium]|jgi:hypothetical protein
MITWFAYLTFATAGPVDLHLAAGMHDQQAGEPERAVVHYKRCLAIEPDNSSCHWEIGWSFWSLGKWAQTVSHWETVQSQQPNNDDVGKWLPTAKNNLAGMLRIERELQSAPATVRPALPQGKILRMRLVGDIMMGTTSPHPTMYLPADDGVGYFSKVEPLLRDADMTFGNLEGPMCDDGRTDKCAPDRPCYAFRQPTRYAKHLVNAGFDMMSIANNHAMDFGEHCRQQTTKTLDLAGIGWSGPPGTIGTFEANGVKVGLVALHSHKSSNYINDHETAKKLVTIAKRNHDIVILSFHGGAEGSGNMHVPDKMELFYGEKRGHLRRLARDMVGAGADIVVGHGPHVLRGLELIDGHLVAYSLGNFGTFKRFNISGHLGTTLVLEVELDHQGKLIRGKVLPVKLMGQGVPEPDPKGTAIALLRDLTNADFPNSGPTIGQDGTFAPK